MSDGSGRRWGAGKRVETDEEARDRLLNAAERCFERLGLRRTTIDDIAREARVSRSTVYRYFDGRGDLLVSAYLRESAATNERLRAMLDGPGPFAERLVEATLRTIDSVRSGKYVPLMSSPDGALLASKAITASAAFYDMTRETMGPYLHAAKEAGEVRADLELDDYNEWMMRLVFSFATVSGPTVADRSHVRKLLEAFLVPSLEPKAAAR
jgi:AcrR family transcriptional regulator